MLQNNECLFFLQVSFVQFSDDAQTEFKLNTYAEKSQALGALANIRYKGGNTKTGTVQTAFFLSVFFLRQWLEGWKHCVTGPKRGQA